MIGALSDGMQKAGLPPRAMADRVFDAIAQRDYPILMGGTLVFASMVVLGNLVADVLYAVVDPRIRYD